MEQGSRMRSESWKQSMDYLWSRNGTMKVQYQWHLVEFQANSVKVCGWSTQHRHWGEWECWYSNMLILYYEFPWILIENPPISCNSDSLEHHFSLEKPFFSSHFDNLTEYSVWIWSSWHHPYIKVLLVNWQSGNHCGHAVAPKAVPQHRGQHGVPVRNMGAILLWQC